MQGISIVILLVVAALIVSSLFTIGILSFPVLSTSPSQGPAPSSSSPSNSFSGNGVNVSSVNYSSNTVEFVIKNTGTSTLDINYGTVTHSQELSSNLLCIHMDLIPGNSTTCRVSNVSGMNGTNLNVYVSYSFNGSESSLSADGNITARLTSIVPVVSRIANYTNATYLTTFIENGLPQGTTWHVLYNNVSALSSANKIGFYTGRGTFTFFVYSVNSSGCGFYPSPSGGKVIAGSSQFVSFYSACTRTTFISPSLSTFPGYPYSGMWQITYNGQIHSATLGNILVFVSNHSYGNTSTNHYSGSVVIYSLFSGYPLHANCSLNSGYAGPGSTVNTSGSSRWLCTTYFNEFGLPFRQSWTISFGGANSSSSTNLVMFSTRPGAYNFVAYPVDVNGSLYTAMNGSANMLAGSDAYLTYNHISSTAQHTLFMESGLPTGLRWSVQVIGTPKCAVGPGPHCEIAGIAMTNSSTTSNITFNAANSTIYHYSFYVPGVASGMAAASYVASPSSGNLTLGAVYQIHFSLSSTSPTTFKESGLPSGTLWNVTLLYPICAIPWIGTYHCDIALMTISNSSTTNTVTFASQSSSEYGFTIPNITTSGKLYVPLPSHGLVNASSTVNVVFSAHNVTNYSIITFIGSGLPRGASWNASLLYPLCAIPWVGTYHCMMALMKITNHSNTNIITFRTPIGSEYGFEVPNTTYSGVAYVPSPNYGLVNSSSAVNVSFTVVNNSNYFNAYFVESGLPLNATWTVSALLNNHTVGTISRGVNVSTTIQFRLNVTSGTYSYYVYNSMPYVPFPRSGTIKAGNIYNINFSKVNTTFSEAGLPAVATWSVMYYGRTGVSRAPANIVFSTPPGTFAYSVQSASNSSGNCTTSYSPSPTYGNLTSGGYKVINFSRSGTSCTTTFSESGLPSNTSWSVTYGASTLSSIFSAITFTGSLGYYNFSVSSPAVSGCTYSPSPSTGTLKSGSAQAVAFTSSCVTNFTQSGLPHTRSWSMIYNGTTKGAVARCFNGCFFSASIYFSVSPGTYAYSVPVVTNSSAGCTSTYTPKPSSGTASSGSSVPIVFNGSTSCTTSFTEYGLPSGASWRITFDNTNKSSFNSTVQFVTGAGGYGFRIPTICYPSLNGTYYIPSVGSGTEQAGSTKSFNFTRGSGC